MYYLLHLKSSVVVSFKTHNIYMTGWFELLRNQCLPNNNLQISDIQISHICIFSSIHPSIHDAGSAISTYFISHSEFFIFFLRKFPFPLSV